MPTTPTGTERVLDLARRNGMVRVRDVLRHGLHPENLRRLCARGLLIRAGRGLYIPADAPPTENRTLAQVCKRVPHGVVCLLSALRFHDLTTQLPHEVWLAIERHAWRPREEDVSLRVIRPSGPAFTFGVVEHRVEGVPVKVYSPAKTVADCFKYRNKVGRDVALEALRDCRRQRKATLDELWRAARVCRVANVMRPYLEATT
jgi:predicted transcriptional regulator of viral defense system